MGWGRYTVQQVRRTGLHGTAAAHTQTTRGQSPALVPGQGSHGPWCKGCSGLWRKPSRFSHIGERHWPQQHTVLQINKAPRESSLPVSVCRRQRKMNFHPPAVRSDNTPEGMESTVFSTLDTHQLVKYILFHLQKRWGKEWCLGNSTQVRNT